MAAPHRGHCSRSVIGVIAFNGLERIDVELCLPSATAAVEIFRQGKGHPLVMLDIQPPSFRLDPVDQTEVMALLGLSGNDRRPEFPIETEVADFVHLIVPLMVLNR